MSGTCCEVGPRGAQGPIGPQGPIGLTGATGATGAQGTQGIQGLTGLTGATGATGANGTNGAVGPAGPAGVPGTDGAVGANGLPGVNGTDGATGPAGERGTKILGSYQNVTGIGNSSATGDETQLFSLNIAANELSQDGDQLELFVYVDYFPNDSVDLIFELDGINRYTYTILAANQNVRFLKIKITRISVAVQLWTIEDLIKDTVTLTVASETCGTTTTAFNLATPMTFKLYADNAASGADQVLLKVITVYKHNL